MLCAALVGVLTAYLVSAATGSPATARHIRRGCQAVMALAVPLFVLGVLAGSRVLDAGPVGTPLLLGGALLLFVYARVLAVKSTGARYPFVRERAAVAVVAALIALCSFWAVGAYAHQKGRTDARMLAGNLALRPAVIVDTPERLYLQWPGVDERALPGADTAQRFRYRYRGLRLLAQSANRMFLIPDSWTWNDGNVLILPMDANVRVAFHPG